MDFFKAGDSFLDELSCGFLGKLAKSDVFIFFAADEEFMLTFQSSSVENKVSVF